VATFGFLHPVLLFGGGPEVRRVGRVYCAAGVALQHQPHSTHGLHSDHLVHSQSTQVGAEHRMLPLKV
jgi:hypothetical protein